MRNVFIIGACSAIAQSVARRYAAEGDRLFLLARDKEKLLSQRDDLLIRGAQSVNFATLDMNQLDLHQSAINSAVSFLNGIDLLLIAHGTLPDQQLCDSDPKVLLQEFQTNAGSTMAFLSAVSPVFERQKHGSIAVITSVAADRGRQSNYCYGAAKAAVSTYLSGLRNRLYSKGVHVLEIKPGFVDTPMTAEFTKGLLWARPQDIARGIVSAVERKKDVVYLPFFWRYIMLIIRYIPEFIFKRLSL